MHSKHVIIGRREKVALPEWGVAKILAKIDTGARTSSIDAKDVTEIGEKQVEFDLVLRRKPTIKVKRVTADVVRAMRVRSSHGHTTKRYVVKTLMRLGSIERAVEFTLAARSKLLCRVLIGRSALAGQFLVDVSDKHMSSE